MIFKKISCHRFSFFARTIPGLECFQGLYQVIYHCFRVGEKQCCGKKANSGKKGNLKNALLQVLRQNRCRYWISECSIGTKQKYNQ